MFTGSYAINPVNGEAIPIWVADYVLISYGTGRDHGRAGPRHPRLRVRQAVRPADYHGGRSGQPWPARSATSCLGTGSRPSSPTAWRSTPALSTACRRPVQAANRRGPGRQGPRPRGGQLQAPRLALQPAAFLGRAVPDPARIGRRGQTDRPHPGVAAERPAGGPAREDEVRREARRARPRRWTKRRTIGSTSRSTASVTSARRTPCRNGPARAGTICGSSTRRTTKALVDPADGEGLDAGRSVRRRGGARRAAPALRPVLAQGALRPRLREHARAVPEARQPGHDPRRMEFGSRRQVHRSRTRRRRRSGLAER